MKKCISLILLFAFLVLLVGCDEGEQYVDPNGLGLEMTLQPVTSTSATIVFTLHSDNDSDAVMTGAAFWLEKEVNGSWERVTAITDDITWYPYEETYAIKANVETEIPVDWSNLYGELGIGKYRIGKKVLGQKEPGFTRYWYTYYAEFEIVNLTC